MQAAKSHVLSLQSTTQNATVQHAPELIRHSNVRVVQLKPGNTHATSPDARTADHPTPRRHPGTNHPLQHVANIESTTRRFGNIIINSCFLAPSNPINVYSRRRTSNTVQNEAHSRPNSSTLLRRCEYTRLSVSSHGIWSAQIRSLINCTRHETNLYLHSLVGRKKFLIQ